MKRFILILILLFGFMSFAFAQDRVNVQVCFRKAVWTCPKCGQEDIQDLNMSGGNIYEHNCSKCGAWFNNFREYNNCLSYPLAEYGTIKQTDINTEKTKRLNDWLYEIKHPAPYIEPTIEQLEAEKIELMTRVNELQMRIDAKAIK